MLPLPSGHDGRLYREAVVQWLAALDLPLFATLNFNRATTPAAARRVIGQLLARLDRRWLGRRWATAGDRRTLAVVFIENPDSNLHAHALLRPALTWPPRRPPMVAAAITKTWATLVPSGQAWVVPVTDAAGISRYVTKQLARPGALEAFFLSTEFHRD